MYSPPSTLNNKKNHWKLNYSLIVLEAWRFQWAGSQSKLRLLGPKIHNMEGNFVWIQLVPKTQLWKFWHLRLVFLENVTNIEMRLSSAHMLSCHSLSVFGHFYIVKCDTVWCFGYIYQTLGYVIQARTLSVSIESLIRLLNFLYKQLPKTKKNPFFHWAIDRVSQAS